MIFGETAFAETALAEGLDSLGVVRPYAALLQSPSRALVIAATIETFDDADNLRQTYVASHGFQTASTDTPASVAFEPRLEEAFTISSSVPTTSIGHFAGVATTTVGSALIRNDDGGLDTIADRAVDGRKITVEVGDIAADGTIRYADFGRVLELRGEGWEWDGRALRLRILDPLAQLDRPMERARYAGTGGKEGTSELEDKLHPVTLGRCSHVPATLIDPVNLVYQVDSGPIQAIDAVYDMGVRLNVDDEGNNVTVRDIAGGYESLIAEELEDEPVISSLEAGLFRLQSPPAGLVTADVRGRILEYRLVSSRLWDGARYWDGWRVWGVPTTSGKLIGYLETHGGLIAAILTLGAQWSEEQVDIGSLVELDSDQPAVCGLHLPAGDETTMRRMISTICQSAGAVGWIDRLGRLRVRRLSAPPATSPRELTERDIIAAERILPPFTVPPFRWVLGYDRIWASFSEPDLAGAVRNTAEAERLTEPFRDAIYEDATIRIRHPTARSTERFETLFTSRSDADAEAQRLAALYSPSRIALRVTIKHLFAMDIGDSVKVTMNRWGLSSGRVFIVTGVSTDIGRRETMLELFG